MAPDLQPRDARDIADAVAQAAASGATLEITGGGTKRDIGRPGRPTTKLSTASLSRVIDHDPSELVLTVEPGAKLADVEALLAQHNQMFAFEPFDFAEISGAGTATIGGMVGAGIAGPRRLSAGSVRDHILGCEAVNGRGEVFRAGGKVVKNVTGYDLPKVMCGSWGQLCVLTELTFKVLPRPEQSRTLALRNLKPAEAVAVMGKAMRSQGEVAAASFLNGLTALRLEGFGPSIEARAKSLERLLVDHGRVETLGTDEAEAHWRTIRTASAFADRDDLPALWRIVVPPAQGAVVLAAIEAGGGAAMLDWAGGLVWAQTPASASASNIRAIAERAGGHALLADAWDELRLKTPALHPEPPGLASLSARVRASFDPVRVFDPQRFEAQSSGGNR